MLIRRARAYAKREFALMRGRELKYTPCTSKPAACVRPHARAGVEIIKLLEVWQYPVFALMRGRELKCVCVTKIVRSERSPSCEGGS